MSIRDYLRPPQAADYIGISQSTLAKLRVSGTGPNYSKRGRSVIYRKPDLDAWIDSGVRNSTSQTAA